MAFTRFPDPTNNISNLANQPVEPPATLKQKFDQVGEDLKDWNNNTFLPELESTTNGDSGADNIGATALSGGVATTVQGVVEELDAKIVSLLPFPDGSIEDVKLSNNIGQIKDVVNKRFIANDKVSINGLNPPTPLVGLVCDGATDDSASFQAIVNYLISVGGGNILLPRGTCKLLSSITLSEKINIVGSGQSLSIVDSNSATYTFIYTTSNGTNLIESPKFNNFTLNCNSGIKLNDPNNGFTDDNTSQKYMMRTYIEKVTINSKATGVGVGVQLSKAFDSKIEDCTIEGFNIDVDLHGCDFTKVNHNRLTTANCIVKLTSYSSFGSSTKIRDNDMGNVLTGGTFVTSSDRDVTIEGNMCEQIPNVIPYFFDFTGGFNINVSNNRMDLASGKVTNAMRVHNNFRSLNVENNNTVGASCGNVVFTGTLNYWYNTIHRRKITHQNNFFSGFPFNSIETFYKTQDGLMITPDSQGLDNSDSGTSIYIDDKAFKLPSGSTLTCNFPFVASDIIGNSRLCIEAKSDLDGQLLTLQIGSGSNFTIALSTTYKKYYFADMTASTFRVKVTNPTGNIWVRSISSLPYSPMPITQIPFNFQSGSGVGRTVSITSPMIYVTGGERPFAAMDTFIYSAGGGVDSSLASGTGFADGTTTITSNTVLGAVITTSVIVTNGVMIIKFTIPDAFNGGGNAILAGSCAVRYFA